MLAVKNWLLHMKKRFLINALIESITTVVPQIVNLHMMKPIMKKLFMMSRMPTL